jgi:hypothetical protein
MVPYCIQFGKENALLEIEMKPCAGGGNIHTESWFIMGELLLLPTVRIKYIYFLRLPYFNFQHLLLVA